MATVSFDRQIKVTNEGARELSRILAKKKPIKRVAVSCKKATREDIKRLLKSRT